MLLSYLGLDETSKSSASKVVVFNLIISTLIISVLTGVGVMLLWDETETAMHVSRLILVESSLHILFYPFTIGLVVGVRQDTFLWVRIWIKASIIQAIYIFLLNIVAQVYISVTIDSIYGIIVLLYTFVNEGVLMEMMVFINNYYRHKLCEKEKQELPKDKV